jgi:outer membrane lipoprotein SlyB
MARTTYDPAVIQKFADKLYSQANSIIFVGTLLGLAIGACGGIAIGDHSTRTTFSVAGAVVLGLLGFVIGSERSFLLKLQAQSALCQMKIEENTRK